MFKKKFLHVACNGYPWTEGNLEGLGFERLIIRNQSVLLIAPRAIRLQPVLKALAVIRLLGYNARLRRRIEADTQSRHVIVVDFERSHAFNYLKTEQGKYKVLAFVVKLQNCFLRFVRCDKYRVLSDDERFYDRKFPNFLSLSQARTFLSFVRQAGKQSKLLAADDDILYYSNKNVKIKHLPNGDCIDRTGRILFNFPHLKEGGVVLF